MPIKLAKIIITLIWSLVIALFLLSIIGLSVPVNGTSGWSELNQKGFWFYFKNHDPSRMLWWANNFKDFLSNVITVLVAVVPILSIIFALVTWQIVVRAKHPKSIEFVDAMKRRRKAHRKSKRQIKKITKKIAKEKATPSQLERLETFWKHEIKESEVAYSKELALWQKAKVDPKQTLYFFAKNAPKQ